MKILEKLKEKEEEDLDKIMESRLKIWNAAIGMCKKDKAAFAAELKRTEVAVMKLAKPVKFTATLMDETKLVAEWH